VDNASLTTGTNWATGTVITIENNGNIVGGGGPSNVDRTLNQAYHGGTALSISIETIVINNGNIIGGA
jgi:hypothetical protein